MAALLLMHSTGLVLAVPNSATSADLAGYLDLANVIAAADSSEFGIQSWIMSVRSHRCWRGRHVSVLKKRDGILRGFVKAMSDNLPVPSSNTFPHAGHFLHRNRKSLGIDWLQILSVCVLFDRNRNLLRINQLLIFLVGLIYFLHCNRNLLRINQL
ncbi:hypothetical protein D6D19_06746 [Aureobasidium pullulans]|uniref:AMP-dependent synthetase/ligase domain-containing protein n=1 Tax=Aureobasidium pullulans TaxID=5580 RepID=A0A4S9A055_AURPU|nr:hypothetical protein D6D19_06746 [Aureobasidium pullulans]